MPETENPRKMPYFWMFLAFLLFGVFIFMWWFLSKKNIPFSRVLLYFIIVAVVICVLIAIVFLALWLFRKQRTDMIHITKQRIIKACELCPPKSKQTLWFMGGTQLETRFIGNVIGIAKAKTEPIFQIVKDKKTDKEHAEKVRDAMDLTFIAFKKPVPFPLSLFTSADLFLGLGWEDKGVKYSDFTHLSANIVYLNGMTFAPQLFGMFFLSQHFTHTFMMDEVISQLIYRYTLQDNLSEIKNIVDETLGISPQHRKIMERSKVHEISGAYQPPPETPKK